MSKMNIKKLRKGFNALEFVICMTPVFAFMVLIVNIGSMAYMKGAAQAVGYSTMVFTPRLGQLGRGTSDMAHSYIENTVTKLWKTSLQSASADNERANGGTSFETHMVPDDTLPFLKTSFNQVIMDESYFTVSPFISDITGSLDR